MTDTDFFSHSFILQEDGFPVDGHPVQSADCVSWGPHNVLQVCSRWSVNLYVSDLLRPIAQLFPRRHPLTYRSDLQSPEVVVGAKWSSQLLPEVFYPATVRLCVRTTANLVVYRITRQGRNCVGVSKGIGIGVSYDPAEVQWSKTITVNGVQMDDPEALSENDLTPLATKRRPVARAVSGASRPGGGKVKDARPKGLSRRRRTRRRADSTSDTASSTSCATISTTEREAGSACGALDGILHTVGGGQIERHSILGFEWMADDVLAVVTEVGVHLVSFWGELSDDEEPLLKPLPPASHVFEHDLLGIRVAPPGSVTKIIVDACDVGSRSDRSYLLVVSPFVVRVLCVMDGLVQLVHCVEVPMLPARPTCVCAIAVPPAEGGALTIPVKVFLATASHLLRGTFTLDISVMRESSVPTEVAASLWKAEASYLPDTTVGPVDVRGFVVASLVDVRATEFATSCSSVTAEAAPTTDTIGGENSHLVVGVGDRGIVGMCMDSSVLIPLFQCPSLTSAHTMPDNAAVAVCGVALHPSCTLSIVLLRMGRPHYAPLLLWPVPANQEGDFLHRMLELNGIFSGLACGRLVESAIDSQTPGRCVSPVTTDNTSYTFFRCLWKNQRNTCYFIWERLFPDTCAALSLRNYVEGVRHVSAEPSPSVVGRQVDSDSSAPVPLSPNMPIEQTLRQYYLQLRESHGVELFLRSPFPDGAELFRRNPTPKGGILWWEALLGLWRRFPCDTAPLGEILLANAVVVVARRTGFAAFTTREGETFRSLDAPCDTTTGLLNYEGALDYLKLYIAQQEEGLHRRSSGLGSAGRGSTASPEHALSGVRAGLWSLSESWCEALNEYLRRCPSSEEGIQLFPCSVCDAPRVAKICSSLSFTSEHVPQPGASAENSAKSLLTEKHTTHFSGATFSPLALFSSENVVTRCLGCGLCDFATGPACRVCGGLMQ